MSTPNHIQLPGFVFDPEHIDLYAASGERIALRPRVLGVLQCLASRAGFVVTKDELLRTVWPGVFVTEDSLVQCVVDLRRALNDDAHAVVRTVPRRGYRLLVTPAPPASLNGHAKLPHAEFHQDIRFATTLDGTRLAHALSGNGAPLVRAAHSMTHLDWDWRSATFGPRIQALSRKHRLLRYDGRGCGLSDRDAMPGSLDECVADLEAVVNSAGLERFALLGTSSGAPIAIRFAARHPRRVTRLVLLGACARGALRRGAASASRANFEAWVRLVEDGWAQDNPAFRQLTTSLYWPGANAQQMHSFNELQRVSCGPETAAALLQRSAEFDASPDLPTLRCPTLVLHNPKDAGVPFEESRLIAASIPGARLEPFGSPNHTPLVDEPAFEQVQQLIEQFLVNDKVHWAVPQRLEPDRRALRDVTAGPREAAAPVRALQGLAG